MDDERTLRRRRREAALARRLLRKRGSEARRARMRERASGVPARVSAVHLEGLSRTRPEAVVGVLGPLFKARNYGELVAR